MIAAETAAAVIIALDIVIWVPLALRWLRVPTVRVLPHPGRHVCPVPPAPRHAATLPRRKPITNRQPWQTQGLPVLTDAATLALYRGDYGTRPVERVLEGERLAGAMLP